MVVALDGKDVYKARPLRAKRTIGDPVQLLARKQKTLLRKQQTDRSSNKKRHCAAGAATDTPLLADRLTTSQLELQQLHLAFRQWEERPSAFTDETLHGTTKRLRHLIGTEEVNPGITRAVIDAKMVPTLVQLLAREHDQPTVYEAVYSLVNVTYITCADVFQEPWAVQRLGKLVATSTSPEIREHAAWCLGNMVCESSKYRDVILEDPNAFQGLIRNLTEPASEAVLKTVSWVCRCIIRRSPRLPSRYAKSFVPALIDLLNKCEASKVDVSMRVNAVMSLAEIMSWGDDSAGYCLRCGVLEPLLDLIRNNIVSPDHHIVLYALRALGEISPEQYVYTKRLVKQGFLECARLLLGHESQPSVQESTCLILSNICTSTKSQALLVHNEGREHEVTRKLADLALRASYKTRVHAAWAVSRLVTSLPREAMHNLEAFGAIEVLVNALRMECEVELISSSLEALYKILSVCRETAVVKFEELRGEDILNDLLYHQNEDICSHTYDLLLEFFNCESIYSEDEDECSCVLREHDESFSFSLPSKQLFPTDCSMEGPPETPARHFDGLVSSPNVLDMSIGETAHI